jgi:hypothetical protein
MTRFIWGLAVTPAATDGRIYIPVVDEFLSQLPLGGAGRRFPVQVGDLIEWPQVILRGAMALQTPSHAVGFRVVDDFHVVDLPMASHTTDAPIYVNGVVEVNVIGGLVNPDPGNGIPGFPGLADGSQFRAEGFDLGVTVHAGLRSGYIRVG